MILDSPDPPPKLVELGKPESLCRLDDHHRSLRNVHTDLDNRGRQQYLHRTVTESGDSLLTPIMLESAVPVQRSGSSSTSKSLGLIELAKIGVEER